MDTPTEHGGDSGFLGRQLTVLVIGAVARVRIVLEQLLDDVDDVVVVGEAEPGQDAVALAARRAPAIVLIDAPHVHEEIVQMINDILTVSPASQPIVLSDDDFEPGVTRTAGAGARGYLPRGVSHKELVRAVRLIARGKAVLECTMTHGEYTRLGLLTSPRDGRTLLLGPKESTVITAMAAGHTDEQIAQLLGLTVPAVKAYVRSILRKTRSPNRAAAIAAAFRSGALS